MSEKRTLQIAIVKGRDLAAKDSSGKSDPYVKVKVAGVKKKTKVIKQNLNPEWHETFYFDDVDDRVAVHLEMFDWDLVGGHDFMGEVTIPSSDIQEAAKASVEKWYPLQKRKAKEDVTGDVLVKMSLLEKPNASFDPKAALHDMGASGHPDAPTAPVNLGHGAPPTTNDTHPLPPMGGPAPPPPPPPPGAPPPPAHFPPAPMHAPQPPSAVPPMPPQMHDQQSYTHQSYGGPPAAAANPMPTGPRFAPPAIPPKRAIPAGPSMSGSQLTHSQAGNHMQPAGAMAPQPRPPMQQPGFHPPQPQPPQPGFGRTESVQFQHPQPTVARADSVGIVPPSETPPMPPRVSPQPAFRPPPQQPAAPQIRVEYDFDPMSSNEIAMRAGDIAVLLEENGEWTKIQAADGRQGWIASNYLTKL